MQDSYYIKTTNKCIICFFLNNFAILCWFFSISFQSFVFCNSPQSKHHTSVLWTFCKSWPKAKVDSLQNRCCFIKVKKRRSELIEIFQTNLFVRFMKENVKSTSQDPFICFHFKTEPYGKIDQFVDWYSNSIMYLLTNRFTVLTNKFFFDCRKKYLFIWSNKLFMKWCIGAIILWLHTSITIYVSTLTRITFVKCQHHWHISSDIFSFNACALWVLSI